MTAQNQTVIVGNSGPVNSGRLVLTEVATSASSNTDPVTGIRTDMATGPLFSVTLVTQPGGGPNQLPLTTVTFSSPPQILTETAQATGLVVSEDPLTGVFKESIITHVFAVDAIALPGPGQGTIILTLTFT